MLEKLASVITRTGFLAAALCVCAVPAYAAGIDTPVQLALSEIKKEELPKAAETAPAKPDGEKAPVAAPPATPAPAASETKPAAAPEKPAAPAATPDKKAPEAPAAKQDDAGARSNPALPNVPEGSPPPHVEYDVSKLPFPVQKMRELILTAAKSGSLEALRPLIGSGDDMTMLSLADNTDGDPIAYLKSLAGDTEGQEILAIAVDILNSGYVHLDAGTPDELYVWPYFFAYPLDKLDAKQRVELFQIVTAGDYDEMKQFGTYVFYRLGITPKGRWRFFVNGD
ncbi:hypothetical protein HB779_11705 [Phyllobacterium sp. 628]|uniref:hypothetical protein n=1 Tax=Phyllobacterium sp. 628 TaxID=2718938 RepID=UPI0016623878|nr:hypothetical protein [Phyllobacterium sp. 628]QND52493.1 hypothetical protein HB779_11705 [Phyllobacterium sp. 628]